MGKTKEDAETAKVSLNEWLNERGLTLSEEKTRIVHLNEGFDFLGFHIKLYKTTNSRNGYKLLIKPSKASRRKVKAKIGAVWLSLRGSNALAITHKLNPIIRGWANYFRIGVAKQVFGLLDHWMFKRTVRYARRTHPTKSWKWLHQRYWGKLNPTREDRWVFGDKNSNSQK